jgi:hypothetical protein
MKAVMIGTIALFIGSLFGYWHPEVPILPERLFANASSTPE